MVNFLHIQPNLFSLTLLLPVAISAVIAIEAFRPKYQSLGRLLGLLMLAIMVWSAAYALELSSTTKEGMQFWLRIEYLAIPYVVPLMLLVVLRITGLGLRITAYQYGYLFLIPVVISVMSITNDHHHLYYTAVSQSFEGKIPLLELSIGPFYYLHIAYIYMLSAISLFVVLRKLVYQRDLFRNQLLFILIAVLIPLVSFTLYILDLMPVDNIDPTPFAFTLSGLAMSIGIFRFRMLDLMPIAREHVFQSMQDGLVVVDSRNRLVDCNPMIYKLFNWKTAPYGKQIEVLWESHPNLVQSIEHQSAQPVEVSTAMDASVRHFLLTNSGIYNHNGRLIGRLLVLHDITTRFELQKHLRQSEEKLRLLNAEKDKLFSVIAHDLRGPIGNFMNYTKLFTDDSVEMNKEEMVEAAKAMHKSAVSLFGLLENLLSWSRMQRDDVKMKIQPLVLHDVVGANLELQYENYTRKNIQIVNQVEAGLKVSADENMLNAILRNLISNAIKFTESGGEIGLNAKALPNGLVEVAVSDTGIGMDCQTLENLYRIDKKTGRPGTEGEVSSGLGLILVKEFVEKQGGSLRAESKVGEGSRFSFTLIQA